MKRIFSKLMGIAFVAIALCYVLGSCKKKDEPKSYQELILGSWEKIKEVSYVKGKENKTIDIKPGTILKFNKGGMGSFGPIPFDYEFEDTLLFIRENGSMRPYYIDELNDKILILKYEMEDGDTKEMRYFVETYRRI